MASGIRFSVFLRVIFSSCCLVFFAGAVFAKPLPSVEDYLASAPASRKYELALKFLNHPETCPDPSDPAALLQSASEDGYIRATVRLGSLYLSGNGVERSAKTAFKLYGKAVAAFVVRTFLRPVVWIFLLLLLVGVVLKAFCCFFKVYGWFICKMAEKGDPATLYKAARRYRRGRGGSGRFAGELDMIKQSAEKGFPPAQVELGHFYRDGIIVQQSRIKAAEWYLKAADQGDPGGLYLAGQCYETGTGVPVFLPKAYGFYLLAAARGHQPAGEQTVVLPKKMTKRQAEQGAQFAREHAEQRGFDWFCLFEDVSV